MLEVMLQTILRRPVFLISTLICSVFTNENISNLHELRTNASPTTIINSITISPDYVPSQLSSLDITKSCGPDCITPCMLKLTADHVCFPLSKMMSFRITLPFDWVSVNIVPIHKYSD